MAYVICILGDERASEEVARGLAGELEAAGLEVGLILPRAQAPSGASLELGVGEGVLELRRRGVVPELDELEGLYGEGLDVLLTLAHPQARRAKIEVCAPGQEPAHLDDPGLRAVVGQGVTAGRLPVFAPGELAPLATFLRDEVIPAREPDRVRVVLGGRRLPIKGFVQDFVGQTLRAMIRTLKGGERPGRLMVFVAEDD
jgi:hypothetical protein